MVLEVRNLKIEYPGQKVFEGVSFGVQENEIIAINTSVLDGGTSLLKGIAGMLNNVEGESVFEDFNLLKDAPDELLYKIGFVYETRGLISIYSVLQNICLPLQFHTDFSQQQMHDATLEVCDLLDITEEDRALHPHELNDVKTRIVNLARALIVKPKLLLIDELEGGMSDEYLEMLMHKMKAWQKKYSMAIVFTTASDIVAAHANRCFKIDDYNLVPYCP